MTKTAALLAGIAAATLAPLTLAAPDDDALAILEAADKATKNVDAVSYTAKRYGIGAYAARVPMAKGDVLVVKNLDNETFPAKGHMKGKAWQTGGTSPTEFYVAFDGKKAYSLDSKEKTLTTGEGALNLLGPGQALFMLEYAHPTPFQDEISAEVAELEGTALVGETLCNVIYVEYGGQFGSSKARWYFGTDDNLPRKVERLGELDGKPGAAVTSVYELEVDPAYSPSDLAIAAPAGFETKTYEAPQRQQPTLLPVGSKAPGWELEDPSGKVHSLAGYEGKIVLMDFWATWCGPCKRAMPGVQALHERFTGQDVAILGINCWESEDGDPAGYMKEQGYTYGLLLGADKVAEEYKVPGIPTFYVIGKDGTILYNSVGASPDAEEKIAEVIEKHLKGDA